jgi:hypothetical protein
LGRFLVCHLFPSLEISTAFPPNRHVLVTSCEFLNSGYCATDSFPSVFNEIAMRTNSRMDDESLSSATEEQHSPTFDFDI